MVCWETPQGLGDLDLGDVLLLAQLGDAGAQALEEGAFVGGDRHARGLKAADEVHSVGVVVITRLTLF
jgi:hypothetical protein